MNFFIRAMGVAAVAVVLASCGGGGDATSTTSPGGGGGGGGSNENCTGGQFCMSATTFFPTTATVTRGSTVTWVNNSGIQHTVTFDDPSNVSGGNVTSISSGTASRTFNTSGTYHFICSIHGPSMQGTLTVQ
jgi:plastocyanin